MAHSSTIPAARDWTVWVAGGAEYVVRLVLLVCVYVGIAGLGLEMIVSTENTPLLWLPAGLGLALAVRGEWRYFPAVPLGAFLVEYNQHSSVTLALTVAAAYTGAALVGGWALRMARFELGLERIRDAVSFLFLGVGLPSLVGAVAVALMQRTDNAVAYPALETLIGIRWLADALGVIVLTPVLVVWKARTRINWNNRQTVEVLIWLALLIFIGAMVFRNWAPTDTLRYPLELSMFPILAWSAVRFGQRGVTAGIVIVCIMAVWELREVIGPEATRTITQPPGYLWAFVGILASTSLFLAAVLAEHQNREDHALRNEERLRAFINAMPDVSFVLSREGRYLEVFTSPSSPGYPTVQSLRRRTVDEIYPPDIAQLMRETIADTIRTRRLHVVEYSLQRDRLRWFEGRVAPMQPVAGEEERVTWVSYEITERKEAEDQLRRAKETADAANLAKGEFLAMMSHEIRTPMNAILGFADLLAQTSVSPDQKDYLKIINRSGKDLLDLINNILDYSKIESRAITLERVPFRIEDTILEVLELVGLKAQSKGLKLTYHIQDDSGGMYLGDPLRLRQILLNLINNAVKFTRQGGVHVEVTSIPSDPPFRRLRLAVRDTGIGIPPDRLERLFKPFSQVDSSTTREYGGTGLGLIISKRLAEKMCGDIQVESVLGQGSTFTVTVHLATGDSLDPMVEPALDEGPDSTFAQRHPLRILLASGDQAIRSQSLGLLRSLGYEPTLAVDENELFQRLHQAPWDFLLCETGPGAPDRLEIVRRIRRGEYGMAVKGAHIVGMTPVALSEEREKCLLAGMNNYLATPLALGRLRTILGKLSQTGPAGHA